MARIRATMHNGHGYARHNDRDFDVTKSDHIDAERTKDNIYTKLYEDEPTFESNERRFYREHFAAYVERRNATEIRNGHRDRCTTTDKLWKQNRTSPHETIMQLGKKEDGAARATASDLRRINDDLVPWIEATFGGHVRLLDTAIHCDETDDHLQQRWVVVYTDENGVEQPNLDKGLEQAGVPLRDPSKPRGQFNNRLQVFTQMCRDKFIELAQERGFDIILEPEERADSKKDLQAREYKMDAQRKEIAANEETIEDQAATIEDQRAEIEDRRAEIRSLEEQRKAEVTRGEALQELAGGAGIKEILRLVRRPIDAKRADVPHRTRTRGLFHRKTVVEMGFDDYTRIQGALNDLDARREVADAATRAVSRLSNEARDLVMTDRSNDYAVRHVPRNSELRKGLEPFLEIGRVYDRIMRAKSPDAVPSLCRDYYEKCEALGIAPTNDAYAVGKAEYEALARIAEREAERQRAAARRRQRSGKSRSRGDDPEL